MSSDQTPDKSPQKRNTVAPKVGHNDDVQLHSVSNFLVPSTAEIFLLTMLAALIMLAFNYNVISASLTRSAQVVGNQPTQVLQPQFDYLNNLITNRFFAQSAVWLVWGIVGAMFYIIVWSFQNFYTRFREDVQESSYVKSSTVREYWYSKLGRYVFMICNLFIFLVFLVAVMGIIAPFAINMGTATINNYSSVTSYRYFIFGLGLLALALYCLKRLGHMVVYGYKTSIGQIE